MRVEKRAKLWRLGGSVRKTLTGDEEERKEEEEKRMKSTGLKGGTGG